jgi:hypothetical protein
MGMKAKACAVALTAIMLLLCGCSEDDNPANPTQGVNQYLAGLPTWSEFSPPLTSVDEQAGSVDYEATWYGEKLYICALTPCSITETPEKITTFNPGSSVLYLGSLIQGSTYLEGLAMMEELPVRQRSPLTISIDLLFPDNTRTVQDPSLASVTQAVGELISAAHDAHHVAGSAFDYQKKTCHSLSQGMLKMGLSAKYLGISARADLEFSRTVEQTTVTAFFLQRMFTASVELPQTPGEFFSSEFTQGKLDEQIAMGRIGPDNLPVYVSSIVYGRILVLTMTSTHSEEMMKAALQASYSRVVDVNVEVSAEHLQVLSESEITIAAVGGEAEHVLSFIRTGNLNEYFAAEAALTAAAPISYTLLNLADNSVALVSETTEYDVLECFTDAVVHYSDYDLWHSNVVGTPGGQVETQMTTAEGVKMADEVNWIPANNNNLATSQLTFTGTTTGLPLDFVVKALEGKGITFNDTKFPSGLFPMLSLGDANQPHRQNDDFDITVTGTDSCTVFAMGTYVGHNDFVSGQESLHIYGKDDLPLAEFKSGLPDGSGHVFMGVVSAVPITRLYFDEGSGDDDICIQDFFFGVKLD